MCVGDRPLALGFPVNTWRLISLVGETFYTNLKKYRLIEKLEALNSDSGWKHHAVLPSPHISGIAQVLKNQIKSRLHY